MREGTENTNANSNSIGTSSLNLNLYSLFPSLARSARQTTSTLKPNDQLGSFRDCHTPCDVTRIRPGRTPSGTRSVNVCSVCPPSASGRGPALSVIESEPGGSELIDMIPWI